MPKRNIIRRGGRRRRRGGMTYGASSPPSYSPSLRSKAESGVKDVAGKTKAAATGIFDKFTNLFKKEDDKTSAPILSTGGRKSRSVRRSRRGGKSRTVRRSRRGGKSRSVRRSRH